VETAAIVVEVVSPHGETFPKLPFYLTRPDLAVVVVADWRRGPAPATARWSRRLLTGWWADSCDGFGFFVNRLRWAQQRFGSVRTTARTLLATVCEHRCGQRN
jgi:hypothetical protein